MADRHRREPLMNDPQPLLSQGSAKIHQRQRFTFGQS